MNPLLKIISRIILLIIITIFYNNYRNNQCIKNQNCEPIFLSSILSFGKDHSIYSVIDHKIADKSMNVDIAFDKEFDKNMQNKIFNLLPPTMSESIVKYIKDINYDDANYELAIKNFILVKKLKIENTKNFPVKIIPKMYFEPVEISDKIKVYNCFCGSSISLKPYESRDLFVYYGIKNSFAGKIFYSFEEDN